MPTAPDGPYSPARQVSWILLIDLMAPMDLYRGLSGSVVGIVLTLLSIKSNGITDGDSKRSL